MIVYHLHYNFIELSLHCWIYIKCFTLLILTNNVRMTIFQMIIFAPSRDQLVCVEELNEYAWHCQTVLHKGYSDLSSYHKFTKVSSPPECATILNTFIFVGGGNLLLMEKHIMNKQIRKEREESLTHTCSLLIL